jgi:dTDP-4-dehydrorhamnose 3,5-epimerase
VIFDETPIPGAWLVELELRGDERGFFARLFDTEEFAAHGLEERFVQVNDSLSAERGTLRGMHYQLPPAQEVKLVRCVRGSLHDVVLDLRPDSATFSRSFGIELSAENRRMMYVPEGCAHGFVTLEPETEVVYFVTAPYDPLLERGVRWDDPRFGIEWPLEPRVLSDKDRAQGDFDPAWHLPEGPA